ncbi:MAG: rRNA maturation RNase YbeY [Planctomycetes bacterium]|nr:rRNA maturation RNase YbeY [Planctomycetota bacterium]
MGSGIELFFTEDSLLTEDEVDLCLLQCCCADILTAHEIHEPRSAGIRICNLEDMSALNEAFCGKHGPTDVLAFPDEEGQGYLGDIIACADLAREQALIRKHSFLAELMFYILHGFLHLLGHDDKTPAEKKEMLDLQKSILQGRGCIIN